MQLIVGKGFTLVPNAILDKWTWTGLNSNDLRVFLMLLRHAYGNKSETCPPVPLIAQKCVISTRQTKFIIGTMHHLRMLEITLNPGRQNTVDLRPAEGYFARLEQPVDNLPGLSTPLHRAPMGTPTPCADGSNQQEIGKSKARRILRFRPPAHNNTTVYKTRSCRTKADRIVAPLIGDEKASPIGAGNPSRTPSESFSVPPMLFSPLGNGNGAEKGRASGPSDSVLLELASVEQIPETAIALRKPYISDQTPGTVRQRIETMIRHELRAVLHVPTRNINRWFCEVPADGILYWINQAYMNGRRPAAWLVSVIARTRGEYPGREGATA